MTTNLEPHLRDAVEHELEFAPELDASEIGVVANDGVVTLTGFVTSYLDRIAAERAALRVLGVRGVANDVQVKLADRRTDTDIAADAVHALTINADVPAGLKVSVRHGVVALEGTVEWMFERLAAESAVRRLRGVKDVANQIRIRPPVPVGEVRTKIEDALRRSAEVDARAIHVLTADSAVTLTGHVRSWAERREAERAAWAARGVARVDNQIDVRP
jgi:osmotically-inducible protein OsmY